MKMTDIKSMTGVDVNNKVEEIKGQLFDLKIQRATSGIEKSHEKRELKKTIARLLTHKSSLEKK